MKARVLSMIKVVGCGLLVLAMLCGWAGPAGAQAPRPPQGTGPADKVPPALRTGPYQNEDGLWVVPEGGLPPQGPVGASVQATGGPDEFGYTWDDTEPLSWIDTTSGTDTRMSGDSWNQAAGPIALPFAFKYYENSYSALYIAASGYVGFSQPAYAWTSASPVPDPSEPNNVIAPYWSPVYIGSGGWVHYLSGGTAPDRYFVIEWHDVAGGNPSDPIGEDDLYRFELILHENGDIVFQYQTMTYAGAAYCGAAGIEDSRGEDGLTYVDFCNDAPSSKAVRFHRPTPAARVQVRPAYQGQFVHAGGIVTFSVRVRNTGDLGADTYDILTSSVWPLSLYGPDGSTALVDTDGDGTIDTGSVPQGGATTVVAKITAPAGAFVGDQNAATITLRSSLNATASRTATLQSAVPAPFAQAYSDDSDGAMSLYLAQPAAQAVKKATPDWTFGSDVAVAETANGFAYFWSRGYWTENVMFDEVEYSLLDHFGGILRPVSALTDHSGAAMDTYDQELAVAVAPNGRMGVVWSEELWDQNNGRSNFNVWFSVLDSAGNRLYGPANLTNNTVWGGYDDPNVPRFYSLRIAATDDNRFVLAWEKLYNTTPSGGCTQSCWVNDIYYAVRDSGGGQVRQITNLTNDTPGQDTGYYQPAFATLSSHRVFVSWWKYQSSNPDVFYAILGSDGSLVKAATNLSLSQSVTEWGNYDAVQLSDGKILAAWEAWGCFSGEWVPRIRFALLDANYNRIGDPICLEKADAATSGDANVSVTADQQGHAILTWTDADWNQQRRLYYALVGSSGEVITDPMIFRTAQAPDSYMSTSYGGYGNTSYSWTPLSGVDGIAAFAVSMVGAPPGGVATLGVHYANHGATTATGVVLTATLGGNLTFLRDSSGMTPTVSGNQVTWHLPDLAFLEGQDFTLTLLVPPGAGYGTRYPVDLVLTSDGPEANPGDNRQTAEVMVARQLFLPIVSR